MIWFACAILASLLLVFCGASKSSLVMLAPVEAVLFDVDGTLCDSDPLHYYAFREMLQEVRFILFCLEGKDQHPKLVGEGNEAFLVRVWKPLPSRCILKP